MSNRERLVQYLTDNMGRGDIADFIEEIGKFADACEDGVITEEDGIQFIQRLARELDELGLEVTGEDVEDDFDDEVEDELVEIEGMKPDSDEED